MWRKAALLINKSRILLFVAPSSRFSSSTPDLAKIIRDVPPKMPWERMLEGGKDYGPIIASMLTFLLVFGGSVQKVREKAIPFFLIGHLFG